MANNFVVIIRIQTCMSYNNVSITLTASFQCVRRNFGTTAVTQETQELTFPCTLNIFFYFFSSMECMWFSQIFLLSFRSGAIQNITNIQRNLTFQIFMLRGTLLILFIKTSIFRVQIKQILQFQIDHLYCPWQQVEVSIGSSLGIACCHLGLSITALASFVIFGYLIFFLSSSS